jgi:hypothetical protein
LQASCWAIDGVRPGRRLVREIAAHGGEGHEDLRDVLAVVARILLLVAHHADDGVREVAHPDHLAERGPAAEELLLGVAAEEGHPTGFLLVLPAREASLRHGDAPHIGEGRQGAGHEEGGVVEEAPDGDPSPSQLRHHERAVG